jgi:hypothetical protein
MCSTMRRFALGVVIRKEWLHFPCDVMPITAGHAHSRVLLVNRTMKFASIKRDFAHLLSVGPRPSLICETLLDYIHYRYLQLCEMTFCCHVD